MSNRKPILCLDFDGVIHSYTSGWQGAGIVPDRPVPGAIEFICNAVEEFRVAIFSSRSCQPGGLEAMKGWLTAFVYEFADSHPEAQRIMALIEWPIEKPAAMVTLDDRALTFTGTWPEIATLKAFRPWNKPAPPPSHAMAVSTIGTPRQPSYRWRAFRERKRREREQEREAELDRIVQDSVDNLRLKLAALSVPTDAKEA